jgi:HSP20 family protein
MKDITRYDPFNDMEDLVKGLWLKPLRLEGQQQLDIKMDVSENDNAYVVHADIPGVKKEDIKVSIAGNQVSIRAEVKKEKEEKKGERVLRSERYYGEVYRSFTLSQDVDQSDATARYKDGVLELTLPKKPGGTSKNITVT